jgi:hypothetical protein
MLTPIHSVGRIDNEKREVSAGINGRHAIAITLTQDTHKNHVCVVGSDQFLLTSSVVVTLVTVIHRETTCPAKSESIKRLVHILFHLDHKLLVNALGDE